MWSPKPVLGYGSDAMWVKYREISRRSGTLIEMIK